MVTTAAHNAEEMLGCNLFALTSDLKLKEQRGRKKLYSIFFILNVFHYKQIKRCFFNLNFSAVLNSKTSDVGMFCKIFIWVLLLLTGRLFSYYLNWYWIKPFHCLLRNIFSSTKRKYHLTVNVNNSMCIFQIVNQQIWVLPNSQTMFLFFHPVML